MYKEEGGLLTMFYNELNLQFEISDLSFTKLIFVTLIQNSELIMIEIWFEVHDVLIILKVWGR